MDNLEHGIYTPMEVSLLPPLHLIYAENPSDSGKVSLFFQMGLKGFVFLCGSTAVEINTFLEAQVHSTVRQRWLNGDELIISSMNEVANIAKEGWTALLEKDYSKLASLMNRNFDLRR